MSTAAFAVLAAGTRGTQDAIANGDTRTISIIHMHTKETLSVTFKRNGYYDAEALKQLNWILRDWRRDEPTRMDPRLFDVAWEVHRSVGATSPFHVVSAYRSPGTNSMLRRRSRGVAKHSQHMEGKAMDFYLPGASMAQVRAVGMQLQRGGVGFYPSAYTPFVHLDVGSVRSWPRMTRAQLAQLFPDGRTVHIPADGAPLEGYEIAKAEIIARGGSVGGFASSDFDEGAIMQSSRRSLWASLFGWNEEDESRPGARGAPRARSTQQAALAYAAQGNGDSADMYALNRAPVAAEEPAALAAVDRLARGRRGQTQTAAAPPAEPAPTPTQQAATPPPPPQPRLVNAPLPMSRPTDLQPVQIAAVQPGSTTERLNWQQGAQGRVQADADTPAGRLVDAPQPPRRPGELLQVAALSAGQAPAVPSLTQAAAPRDPPGRLVTVDHPAPPERPRSVLAGAPAQQPAPQPPAAQPGLRPTAQPAAEQAPNPDRRALDNLFAAAATGAVPRDLSKIIVSRTRAAAPSDNGQVGAEAAPAAALGFTQRDPNDTRADRFTGPAVRPLPTTFTSR